MVEISRVPDSFQTVFKTFEGRRFLGRIVKVPESNPTTLIQNKRLLKVPSTSYIKIGDMIKDLFGNIFLLSDGTIAMEEQNIVSKSFVLNLVNSSMTWFRPNPDLDPVTGLEKGTKEINMGIVYGHLEVIEERLERTSKMTNKYEQFKLLTGSNIVLGDIIGGEYRAKRVTKQAGIWVVDLA